MVLPSWHLISEQNQLVIDLNSIEAGYYHVPTYMAYEQGDLVFQVPLRSLIAIDTLGAYFYCRCCVWSFYPGGEI